MTPGLRIGRYEVGERLGKGGFGVVHVARDVELGRDVAIPAAKQDLFAQVCMRDGFDPRIQTP